MCQNVPRPKANGNPPACPPSRIEERLACISFDLLFEVLRASNYLECEGLLKLASKAVARLFGALREEPEALASVLGLRRAAASPIPCTSASLSAIRPWSTLWSALVNEPVLEPPEEPPAVALAHTADADHLIKDEDALGFCLMECDAAVRTHPTATPVPQPTDRLPGHTDGSC